MHNDSIARGLTRALVALVTAAAITACADDTPVQPKARVPDGGLKSASMTWGWNILPTGTTFPAKIAFVTGSPNGKAAYVQVYNKSGGQMARFKAFGESWSIGGVDVALGDVNGDGYPDIIVGEGPANFAPVSSRVGVWDGKTGAWINGIGVTTGNRSGLRVGAGDIDGDGRDEIFTCFGPSSEPTQLNVLYVGTNNGIGFKMLPTTLATLTGKNSYNGCRATGADLTGDGKDEIVAVFEGPANTLWVHDHTGTYPNVIRAKPLGADYTGMISVAAGDVNKDGRAEVFLGRLTALDKLPAVKIFDGAAVMGSSTLPTPTSVTPITNSLYNTGIYIAAHDLNGDGIPELLAKVSTTAGFSTYVAKMGPSFTSLWLNQFEPPGTVPAGGPIG